MKQVEFKPVKGYTVINDNLGHGSFGKTILIKDESLDEVFVCKKYEPQPGINEEEFFDTFKKEIKLMYQINHPNIIRIFTYYLYETSHTGYIIMEYIDGESIDEWFANYIMKSKTSNDIFRQLIEGFANLEAKGIVHRDIRESNILISKNDEVKIIDFGLGKRIDAEGMSVDSFNSIINRAQMKTFPNEFSEGKYNSLTDMFCLAELFSRMLELTEMDDFKYKNTLNKMMNKIPEKRFKSFFEILSELDKKDFSQLNITASDKKIYGNFVNPIFDTLTMYTGSRKIENSVEQLLIGIEEVLNNNCLEEYLTDPSDIISVIVKGSYRYYKSNRIAVNDIQKFFDWLIDKDDSFKQIVMRNIVNKFNSIDVVIEDDDLPF